MCVAIPGKVISIEKDNALLDFGGIKKKINIFFIEDVNLGDYLLVHAGCAIEKISKDEALETLKVFKEIFDKL